MARPHHFLIAAGTARYAHLDTTEQLPSVAEDIALVAGFFAAGGYQRVLPELGESPSRHDMERRLGGWLTAAERTAHDVLVLYYSGHGESVDDDAHYLVFRDTEYSKDRPLPHTALADDQLARLFAASPVQHALLILDTCYAGRGITGLSARAGTLLRKQVWDSTAPQGIYLIAASRPRETAAEYVFARTFVDVAANRSGQLGGPTQRYLEPGVVVGAVNEAFAHRGVHQRAVWMPATVLATGSSELIPNPMYQPDRPVGLVLEGEWLTATDEGEGAAAVSDFYGRERALRELVAWLSAPPDGRARVLTGGPGTGKSALLARLVALADPATRERLEATGGLAAVPGDTVPAPGAFDAVVHARGKALDEVVGALSRGLGRAALDASALVRELRERDRPATLLVDALDEAADAGRIGIELLRELAPLPTVRLLVGTRPEVARGSGPRRVRSLGGATVELDLDDPAYLGPSDVEDYVTGLLLASDRPGRRTPYRGQPALAREVARAVAARAGRVFLFARIVGRTLAAGDSPVDTRAEGWRERLPVDAGAAFEEYLSRFDAGSGRVMGKRAVVDLLRPLAFAEGEGLARDNLWAPLAGAIAGREYLDDDLAAMLRLAGAYVVEGSEQGRSAYRLYHDLLADHLRGGRDATVVHGQFVDTLLAAIPQRGDGEGRDWGRAHPYVVSHLATHAARAGRLDELVTDPLFLAVADRGRLLRVLPRVAGERARRFARVYEMAAYPLEGRDPAERLAYLELTARQHGGRELLAASAALRIGRPWRAAWAEWTPAPTHRVLAEHAAPYAYVTAAHVSGEALLLVAAGPGASAYRIDDGSRLFHASSEDLFGRLAAGSLAGEAVVVAPTARGPLRLWRLADGGRIAEWRPREVDLVDALALVELRSGQSVVVAGSRVVWPADGGGERVGAVEVWAIDGPEPRLVRTLEGPTGPAPGSREAGVTKIVRIAPVTYRGTPMLVVVGWDGSIRLSDPETGTAVLDVPGGWGPVSDLAAATTSAGLALVLSGDGIVRVVHVAGDGSWTGATLPVGHGKGFTPVAAGEIAGERVCASVGADHRVRIWRLSDAALLAEAPVALEGDAVTGLAVTTSGGEPVVVTGDSRGTVRVWPYRALAEAAEARGSAGHIEAVHALRAPGQCRLVTRERSGKVALWNASDGSRLRPAWLAGEEPVRLAAGMLGDRPVVALLDRSGVLRASFADDGAPCGRPIRLAGVSLDLPIGFCAWRGRPHAAAVLHWREMALYDLESGDLVGVAPVGANEWSSRFMSPEKPVVPPWSFVLVPSEWGPLAVTFGYPDCFEAWPLTSEAQTAGSDRGLAETAVTVAPGLQFLVERPLATGTVRAAAACTAGDRPLVAAWRYGDAVLRLYDVTERQPVGEPLPASDLGAIACAEDRGEVLVAAGTPRGEIRLWRGAELRLTVHTNCALHGLALLGTDGLAIAASEGLMVLRLSEHG